MRTHILIASGGVRARAGPKCAADSNTGRGLEMCRGLEVVAFAAWNGGFCRWKSRLFYRSRPGLFFTAWRRAFYTARIGGLFFTARIGGLSERSDAIRPSGLGVSSRFFGRKAVVLESDESWNLS